MIKAGASQRVINPDKPQFLFGYPHVERYSNGVHDSLESAALYLSDGNTELVWISNDLIFVSKEMTAIVRQDIHEKTGVASDHILISATHTHSGPITVNYASNTADPVVPNADKDYIAFVCAMMTECVLEAVRTSERAEVGLVHADSNGIGTNRRDPEGPSNHDVPVLLVRSLEDGRYIACMLVVSMHPTVLHEDSTLISADFIGAARIYIKEQLLTENCAVLIHNGPCGNQSPRHVVEEQTFAQAKKIGEILGRAVLRVVPDCSYRNELPLDAETILLPEVPRRPFPVQVVAEHSLARILEKRRQRQAAGAPAAELRTLECDIFGAEEMVTLSKMQAAGALEPYYRSCLPVEIQMLKVGPWKFVGWSGEVFTDYALQVVKALENVFIIAMANGETQGYIVTEEADREGGYESSNALFSYQTGELLVQKTLELCNSQGRKK